MKHKRKVIIYISFVLLLTGIICINLLAGNKQEKKEKTSNDLVGVYVTGSKILKGRNSPTAGYWKNGEWVSVSTKLLSNVTSIAIDGNDIYAVGSYSGVTDVWCSFIWNNGIEKSLFIQNASKDVVAYSVFVLKKDVYVIGSYKNRSNKSEIGFWKNNNWFKYDSKINLKITSADIYNDVIYLGGFTITDSGKYIPGFMQNREWIVLPIINKNDDSCVKDIKVINGIVYAGGYYINSFKVSVPGYWKNNKWVELPTINSKCDSEVNSIVVYTSDVYAAGYSINKKGFSGVKIAGYWKNGEWTFLVPEDSKYRSEVKDICVYNGDVYAAGINAVGTGKDVPGYWKNGEWIPFEGDPTFATVTSIVVVPRNEEAK